MLFARDSLLLYHYTRILPFFWSCDLPSSLIKIVALPFFLVFNNHLQIVPFVSRFVHIFSQKKKNANLAGSETHRSDICFLSFILFRFLPLVVHYIQRVLKIWIVLVFYFYFLLTFNSKKQTKLETRSQSRNTTAAAAAAAVRALSALLMLNGGGGVGIGGLQAFAGVGVLSFSLVFWFSSALKYGNFKQ